MARSRRLTSAKKRLLLAVGAGLLSAVLMMWYAGSLKEEAHAAQNAAMEEYGGERTEVLVATRDILAGEELSADNTTLMPWLSGLLPQGAITNQDDAYGHTVCVPIWAHEPLLLAKLSTGSELISVPDGLSAVCIPVTDDMAVGGSLLPGSSVDVYAIGSSRVRLVAADVLVLEASNGIGAGQSTESDDSNVMLGGNSRAALKWVTLAVADETIVDLLAAARDSTLSIVLPGENAGGALLEQAYPEETPHQNAEAGEIED